VGGTAITAYEYITGNRKSRLPKFVKTIEEGWCCTSKWPQCSIRTLVIVEESPPDMDVL
jgi:hypothetical protein